MPVNDPASDQSEGGVVRLRVTLAYDGTEFHGWALQPGLRTVQGVLEDAIALAFRGAHGLAPSALTVAGRTDSGVHATEQVAQFDLTGREFDDNEGNRLAEATERRLRSILKRDPDLVVSRVDIAPPGFDARFSALRRTYEYRIADSPRAQNPLRRRDTLWTNDVLDLVSMQAASQSLLGLHDWAAYCKPREGATTIRDLQEFSWRRDDDGVLVATIVADAFCHNQVRSMVGAAIAVGSGRLLPDALVTIRDGRRRTNAFAVVPARGLTLRAVEYPDETMFEARAAATRARRAPLPQ